MEPSAEGALLTGLNPPPLLLSGVTYVLMYRKLGLRRLVQGVSNLDEENNAMLDNIRTLRFVSIFAPPPCLCVCVCVCCCEYVGGLGFVSLVGIFFKVHCSCCCCCYPCDCVAGGIPLSLLLCRCFPSSTGYKMPLFHRALCLLSIFCIL